LSTGRFKALTATSGTLAKTSKIQCLGEIGQLRRITVYPFRYYITVGGLISYGSDVVRLSRPATGYVNRILKAKEPANLPVQVPTKYELIGNKAIGIQCQQRCSPAPTR
jgi:putative tryptophan/tyrosine transport system substrate-binding protein